MVKTAKIITTLSATLVFLMCARSVYAEGLNVSADKESCELSDKVTITIDAEGLGDGTVPPDIQVEYSPARLNFETCSVDYGGGGGGLVTFKDKSATIEFTTLSGGAAQVNVTATADDAASPETASVTVSVNGEDTAAAAEAATTSTTGVTAATIDIGEGRVIQTVFADEFKPVLFHKEVTDYNGQSVECAKFDMGDMTLLYTTDTAGADGRFMIYNPAMPELGEFRMIQGIENRFIIVLSDCEGPIPDGYTKAVLEWDGQTLTAFMEESVAAGAATAVDGIDPSDFFLVYAMSSEGNKGWYRYDKNEGTYQRFVNTGGTAENKGAGGDSDDGSSSSDILADYIPANIRSILVLILAPLALILLITVIVLAVKVHDYGEDLDAIYDEVYGDDEDEDDEEEEEVPVRRTAKPGAVTAASLVGRSMSEEESEEDDEDEEEEEDEEEDEVEERDEDVEEDDEEEEEEDPYDRPLTRRERKQLEKEEKWRAKEEKKAAKRRLQGYEEATPMDWSTFGKEKDEEDVKVFKKSKPPKYMTESMEPVGDEVEEEEPKKKKAPLPPRKKTVYTDEEQENPKVLHEEDQREKQRRLFEQQQRIEEQRRIEEEQREAARRAEQQKFIASKTDDLDLDEDFQFEFLNLD